MNEAGGGQSLSAARSIHYHLRRIIHPDHKHHTASSPVRNIQKYVAEFPQ